MAAAHAEAKQLAKDAAERRRDSLFAPPTPVAPTEPSRPEPTTADRRLSREIYGAQFNFLAKAESEEDAEGGESFQQQPAEPSNAGSGGARGGVRRQSRIDRARTWKMTKMLAGAATSLQTTLTPRLSIRGSPRSNPSESPQGAPGQGGADPQALALSTVAEMSSSASLVLSESGRQSSMVRASELELGI